MIKKKLLKSFIISGELILLCKAKKAVTAYLSCEQLLHSGFAPQNYVQLNATDGANSVWAGLRLMAMVDNNDAGRYFPENRIR